MGALAVWRRNALVWRKLIGPSLMINFGEPFLYLLGMGYGLGRFIGEMAGMPYLSFLASGSGGVVGHDHGVFRRHVFRAHAHGAAKNLRRHVGDAD